MAGDHVTATITRAPMRSRQLHMKEVLLYYPKSPWHCVIMMNTPYSPQDYLLTMHFSLLELLEAYHKVCLVQQEQLASSVKQYSYSLSLSLSPTL